MIDELDKARHEIEMAESQIEELKQQLDVALSAEDMLEQLTERTLNMGEVSQCVIRLSINPSRLTRLHE